MATLSRPLGPHPLVVVAHDLRSAHNVGSVFRTADAAGVAHVYLTGTSPTPDHRGVQKTALGAQDSVAWTAAPDLNALLDQLRADGVSVAALEITPGAVPPEAVPAAAFPLALVLGNEVDGVPANVIAGADLTVALPMYGAKASLNVSVAFGVAAYGLVARWRSVRGDAGGA